MTNEDHQALVDAGFVPVRNARTNRVHTWRLDLPAPHPDVVALQAQCAAQVAAARQGEMQKGG